MNPWVTDGYGGASESDKPIPDDGVWYASEPP
jgi:hypothetical protein